MFGLGVPELLIILALVLLLFGGARLAGLGKSTGRALREFKEETKDLKAKDDDPRPVEPYRPEPYRPETQQQQPPAAPPAAPPTGPQAYPQSYNQSYNQGYPQSNPQNEPPINTAWQTPPAGNVQDTPSGDVRKDT